MKTANTCRYSLLGLPFDAVSLEQAVLQIENAIKHQQKCFVSTPNLNFVMMAKTDLDFYQSVVHSDLVVADGMPIVWAAKLLGIPIKERVAGSDLFQFLSSRCVDQKIRVFFFGGEFGVAEKAHSKLNQRSIGMISCGYHDPGFVPVDQMGNDEIINKINATKPDFIVVALGAKKGQQWIMENHAKLSAPVISHLGAVINFVAEEVKRAPENWQKTGFEWLWRIKQEPKLFKRYAADGLQLVWTFLLQVLPLALYSRYQSYQSRKLKGEVKLDTTDAYMRFLVRGSLTAQDLADVAKALENQSHWQQSVELDMQHVAHIDATGVAELQLLEANLRRHGVSLFLKAVPRSIQILFWFYGVRQRFQLI